MRKYILLILSFTILLSGCSIVEANRIYTICQISNGKSIAYNNSNEFVLIDKDGNIHAHSGVGVTARPVLSFHPSSGEYVITATSVPSKYFSTLESLEKFVQVLVDNGATYDVSYATWSAIDIYVSHQDWKCRCLWDIQGNLFLYFIDNENNPIAPLFLNIVE